MLALLRFDVGPRIGAGHMSRCLALAGELGSRGYEITCAVNALGVSHLPEALRSRAIALQSADADPGSDWLGGLPGPADIAIVDHYGLDTRFEARLRTRCKTLVVLDDLADRRHDADILIDTAPGQSGDRYAALVPSSCLSLLGPDYALLRDQFGRSCTVARPSFERDRPLRILVSMGAVDGKDVSSLVLKSLRDWPHAHEVTVVLGRGAPHVDEVRRAVAGHPNSARLIENASDMASLYLSHDLAIGAPGTSALERACIGLPQILIETAANQSALALGLDRSAVLLGSHSALNPAHIGKALAELVADPARMRDLATAGRRLVDGRGAQRVAALMIAEMRDRRGQPLAARPLRESDSEVLYAWQTAAETRRYFHDPAPPTRAGHQRFIEARLSSSEAYTEMITRVGVPVALVRADPSERGYTVSIVVAPEARGSGIGTAAIRYLDALLPRADLTAHVHAENVPSLLAFKRAGFGPSRRRRLVVEPSVTELDAAGRGSVA